MEWIDRLQRELGAPFVALILDNWIVLLVAVLLAAWYLFGIFTDDPPEAGIVLDHSDEADPATRRNDGD